MMSLLFAGYDTTSITLTYALYLISQHALPDEPLIAMVPMSLRQDDSTGGNQIGMILANLAPISATRPIACG